MKRFELLEHTADIKMRVFGTSIEEVFKNAAYGMACIQKEGIEDQELKIQKTIEIESIDIESLLVDFLSEILTLSDTYQEAYPKVSNIKIKDKKINAEILGFSVDHFDEDIKAATYHEVKIEEKNRKWEAEVIFDI